MILWHYNTMKYAYQDWQAALADVITDPQELCQFLALNTDEFAKIYNRNQQKFPLRVPRSFAARMEKGNFHDPLLLQVLPINKESLPNSPSFCKDPLQEKHANPAPGLLHKYHGRVLLIASGGCAIHCRYCFRRHFPYEENTPGASGWQAALDYISQDTSINEVILSGGDPLILKDNTLKGLIERLENIKHLQILRLHTRIPVVLPERITPSLVDLLSHSRLKPVLVIHCNHSREIDHQAQLALTMLQRAGIILLNQFVLLKDINDQAGIIIELCQKLVRFGVLPYYLHLLDPVEGAEHFSVSAAEGKKIMTQITEKLPGYLVPKFVCEIPNAPSKSSV